MRTITMILAAVLALSLFLAAGCCTRKKTTIIEQKTERVLDSKPVVSGQEQPAPPPAQPGETRIEETKTIEQRVISREPVVE